MRYLASISYDGSHFYGFQRLNNGMGVQNELERVLLIVADEFIHVHGAGRTDRGVHALEQCVHFDLDKNIPLDKLKMVMNRLLNPYVSIINLHVVSSDFHARHDVLLKTYLYKVYVGEKNPFISDYAYVTYDRFDLELMKKAAMLFVGRHNFKNFVSGQRDNYESVINIFMVERKGDYYYFRVTGKSFYKYMVRSLVGAIMDVGLHKKDISLILKALERYDEDERFLVVPSEGLYLEKVEYSSF